MNILQRIDKWHQTKLGLAVFMLVEGTLGIVFGSLAINGGSLFDYALTLLLIILFVQDAVAFIVKGTKQDVQKKAAKPTKDKNHG